MNMPVIYLKEGREKAMLRRHPWIFSGAIHHVEGTPASGETVEIRSSKDTFLAVGAYSPESAIRIRIWSFRKEEIGPEFFERKFAEAYALRKTVFGGTLPDSYRLVNAESDGLPGIVVDLYGGYAVCQLGSAGAEAHRKEIAETILHYAEGVLERSDIDSRIKEGLPLRTGHLAGKQLSETIRFRENGILYEIDPAEGHKTGFYLDQRMNRKAVMDAAAGMEDVLNCFCYTGGFGLAAALGGAGHVLNVDSSAPALALARKNAELNGLSEAQFETAEADVFQFLRKCRDANRTFDMIILDPPKFAETVSQVPKAARAYKDINLLAMKLLNPGGRLFTFSCSGAMDDVLFLKVIDSAASDAKIDFRITGTMEQGPDHPVSAFFPEGRYLKGLTGIKTGDMEK